MATALRFVSLSRPGGSGRRKPLCGFGKQHRRPEPIGGSRRNRPTLWRFNCLCMTMGGAPWRRPHRLKVLQDRFRRSGRSVGGYFPDVSPRFRRFLARTIVEGLICCGIARLCVKINRQQVINQIDIIVVYADKNRAGATGRSCADAKDRWGRVDAPGISRRITLYGRQIGCGGAVNVIAVRSSCCGI